MRVREIARAMLKRADPPDEVISLQRDEVMAILFGPGVNSEERLDVMLALTRKKPASVFWPVFHGTWSLCDDTWHLRRELLAALWQKNAEAPGIGFLPVQPRALFDAIPDSFVVHRGCSESRIKGVSWTPERNVAESYARGHFNAYGVRFPNPVVVTATVPKSAIYGVYLKRDECEIVLDPRALSKLSVNRL
jgi:hypothetical protein